MAITVSPTAIKAGFAVDNLGAHTSRTIMLTELGVLLAACPPLASPAEYRTTAVEQNVLLKPTLDARKKSIRHLFQLYGLSLDLPVFSVLRELWASDPDAQPLLAILCALTRDPILRTTVDLITTTSLGTHLRANQFQQAIANELGSQLSVSTLASAGRNATSSWEQAGYLHGVKEKVRKQVLPTPIVTAYALFLAYLNGERGEGMFFSPWCKLLDLPPHAARAQAEQASQRGWLEYRCSGQVTEITFRHFLKEGQYE